jgi:MFS family permease
MAVVLNEIFFPKTDAHTAALLSAFAFCSTYVLRPFGALIFGYIGDYIGRKTTVIITTAMMAMACIIMANLPTYAQIGITAAWTVTLCRILQGLSSMGEIIGAEIYLTEITPLPMRYPCVGLIGCSARFGTAMALGVATLILSCQLDWRVAFWIGSAIAMVGFIARIRLYETPDFIQMKQCQAENKKKVNWQTILAFFLISSGPPACLYFSYLYCGNIYKHMGFDGEYIINQNFIVSFIELLGIFVTVLLSYKIHPLKSLKLKSFLFLMFLGFCPAVLTDIHSSWQLLIIQFISVLLTLTGVPAVAALIVHFPVYKRFTYTSFMYALSRALIYVVTSFGLVYLTEFLGPWGLWAIMVPTAVGFLWGILHFEKLEIAAGQLPEKKMTPIRVNG